MKIQCYKPLLDVINESQTSMNKYRLLVFAYMLTNKNRYYKGIFSLCINEEIRDYFRANAIEYRDFFLKAGILVRSHKEYEGPIYYTLKDIDENEIVEVTLKSKTAEKVYIKHNMEVFNKKTPFKFTKNPIIGKITKSKKPVKHVVEKQEVEDLYKDSTSGVFFDSTNDNIEEYHELIDSATDIDDIELEKIKIEEPVVTDKWDAFSKKVRELNDDLDETDIDEILGMM